MRLILVGLSLLWSIATSAASLEIKPVKVTDSVYAVIGDLGNQSYENDGLNANLGFVVGNDAVLVINTGPSRRVAEALHAAIQRITDKPVKWVVNVNSQNHYWHGNDYFQKLGATLVAHAEADRLMRSQGPDQLASIRNTLKDKANDTKMAFPTETFTDSRSILLGRTTVELHHYGSAHTPGDIAVWLPQSGVLFSGDLGFTGRILLVLPVGSTAGWVKSYDSLAALKPRKVVPGHGNVGTLADIERDTRDYLKVLRDGARRIFEAGGSLDDAVNKVDQSRYKNLQNFDLAARRNMNLVYQEIEKELF